jgi:hypothetical protein
MLQHIYSINIVVFKSMTFRYKIVYFLQLFLNFIKIYCLEMNLKIEN